MTRESRRDREEKLQLVERTVLNPCVERLDRKPERERASSRIAKYASTPRAAIQSVLLSQLFADLLWKEGRNTWQGVLGERRKREHRYQ
jgi:hypothetical protein